MGNQAQSTMIDKIGMSFIPINKAVGTFIFFMFLLFMVYRR